MYLGWQRHRLPANVGIFIKSRLCVRSHVQPTVTITAGTGVFIGDGGASGDNSKHLLEHKSGLKMPLIGS